MSSNYICIHSSCACYTCYVMSAYMHLFHQDGGFMSSYIISHHISYIIYIIYHVTSHHIISYHITSYLISYIISYHITSYSVCHNYHFILLFQMLAHIQLQYSVLPEYTEFQPSVQQLKTTSAQQFYNHIITLERTVVTLERERIRLVQSLMLMMMMMMMTYIICVEFRMS